MAPGHPAVLNELGLRMMQRGDAIRARELFQRAIQARVADIRTRHGDGSLRRAQRCIELLTARRRRYLPEPTFSYFPEIPAVEFFARDDFPWLDAIEMATAEIRAELTAVLISDRAGLAPYIAYPAAVPLDQWQELNRSRRWSAYFLWNQGVAELAHLARCPRCEVAGHAPTAFFS